uniref:TPX2 central domain-containing protein n=1 Tax=Opuntia streptacantha TaxID=393608 RepID=A0A7C8YG81_OPUST
MVWALGDGNSCMLMNILRLTNCSTEILYLQGLNKTSANHISEIGYKDPKRSDSSDVPKTAACQTLHHFKARPLDSKILTSRGDIGVFRNSKREVTVPKEFEFQTAKRNQQNPPIELFSKLSLNGESQLKSCGKSGHSRRTSIPSKGSKENRWESCLQNTNMTCRRNEKNDSQSGKHMHSIVNGGIGETDPQIGISRTCGSWRQ